MKISRRDFLRLLGITGTLAGGYSRVWAVPDEWKESLLFGPRIETWKVSTCNQCPAGCGIRVRLIDGIPVRILGNPIAPVNRGFTCPMGEAGLELLYHPDRITQPLKRNGKKGAVSFEAISWDEAMNEISGVLKTLREEGRPERFGFIMGDGNTLLTHFAGEFSAAYGSPNFHPLRAPAVNELGLFQAAGKLPSLAFDLEQCDYLLTFETNLLEETPSPVHFNSLYGNLKGKRARTGLKMVHVSSRMSQAGINATEWVKVRPGSIGVLALGMIYVIMRDNIFDQDFIGKQTADTKNIEQFQDMVSRDYYPDRVSQITGVPAQTVIRLARGFGSARAPVALSGGTPDAGETALFNQWAVASLNAVAGSFSRKGLWREQEPLPIGGLHDPAFNARTLSFSNRSMQFGSHDIPASWVTEHLPELSEKGIVGDLTMLMVAKADPLYRTTNRRAWEGLLGKIPNVIQFATLLDDTSAFADIVLPIFTYLEEWDLTLPVPNIPFAQVGLTQPIVNPIEGPRHPGDILAKLAGDLGVGILPRQGLRSYREYLKVRMKQIFDSGKGTPYFEEVSLEFLEEIRKRGWQVYSYPAFSDFWQLLTEKGGWWDPDGYPGVDWSRQRRFTFPTPSKLAELRAERSFGGENMDASTAGQQSLRWLEEKISKADAPDVFILSPFITLINITGFGASQPLLQELFGFHPRLYWQTWAEMNPERARSLNVNDGDHIRVITEKGSFTLTVRVVPTVSKEVLAVPFGQGHRELGRYAKNIGTNAISYLNGELDPLSGRPSWQTTRVRVEKITE